MELLVIDVNAFFGSQISPLCCDACRMIFTCHWLSIAGLSMQLRFPPAEVSTISECGTHFLWSTQYFPNVVVHYFTHLQGDSETMSFYSAVMLIKSRNICVNSPSLRSTVGTFVKMPCLLAGCIFLGMHARRNIWHYLVQFSHFWSLVLSIENRRLWGTNLSCEQGFFLAGLSHIWLIYD